MIRPALIVCACVLATGCSTGWRLDERRVEALDAVRAGDHQRAAATFNQLYDSRLAGEAAAPGGRSRAEGSSSDKHGLLWRLERGLLALHADDTAGARTHLAAARERAEILMAADLAAGAASAIANDTVRDYVGSAFEREASAYFLGLAELIDAQRGAGLLGGAAAAAETITTLDRYDRAINELRNLSLVQTPQTAAAAGKLRYRGSAWFHCFAAATVLAHPQPLDSDLDFADEMLRRAERRYARQHQVFDDHRFRYEVPPELQLVELLRWRSVMRRGEVRRGELLRELAADPERLRHDGLLPPRDHGSVLVLEHRGFVVRPQPLDIRLVSSDLGSFDRQLARDQFRVGWMLFSVRGPGAWQVADWGILPVPGQLSGELAPGGLSVMGFSVPAHAPDHPIGPPPVLHAQARDGDWDGSARGEVVCDPDAWARAELVDRQVQVVLKTLIRTVLKQVAAGQAAHKARQHEGELAGLLVNLIASSLATASEQADIRAVTMLPDHITATLLDLPAGRHQLALRRGGGERRIASVDVLPGQLVVLPIFDPLPIQAAGLASAGR